MNVRAVMPALLPGLALLSCARPNPARLAATNADRMLGLGMVPVAALFDLPSRVAAEAPVPVE